MFNKIIIVCNREKAILQQYFNCYREVAGQKVNLGQYRISPISYHSELEWNFCGGFSWEGLQVIHMVFAYHWTS